MKSGENKLELTEAVFDLGTMCCDVLLPVFNYQCVSYTFDTFQWLPHACLHVQTSLVCFCFFFFILLRIVVLNILSRVF